jgi:multiple sugar transport system permease protein
MPSSNATATRPTAPAATTAGWLESARGERIFGYALLVPAFVILVGVVFYPILLTFWYSLHRIDLRFPGLGTPFVGLGNYAGLLTDPFYSAPFGQAVFFTVVFALVSVSLEMLLGLAAALLMHKPPFASGLTRAVVLIPWAVPGVVAATMWRFMLDVQAGIFNTTLLSLRLEPINFLGNSWPAFWSLVAAGVWKTTPYVGLLLLAGLQTIPEDVYEAAKVDGASAWQRFRRVTLPLLRPAILVALLFRFLDAIRTFDLPLTLTDGGPAGATTSLSILAYRTFFQASNFGVGSALSVVNFFAALLFAMLFIRVLGADLVRGKEGER